MALEVACPSGCHGEEDELVWPAGSQDDTDIIQDAAVVVGLTAIVGTGSEETAEYDRESGPSAKKTKTDALASATDVAASLALDRVFTIWFAGCVCRVVSYRGCRNHTMTFFHFAI